MKSTIIIVFLCVIFNISALRLPPTTQSPPSTTPGPDRSGDITLNGVDYFFTSDSLKMTWEDANSYCKNKNMNLISIETYEENLKVVTHLLSLRHTQYLDGTWTSGKRNPNGSWLWNGTGKPLEYTAWFDNHPLPREDRDRIAIAGYRTKVRWVSLPHTDTRRFICEKV